MIYHSVAEVLADRRKGVGLNSIINDLLKTPDLWEPYGPTPFSIIETIQSGDYLDCTTPLWLSLYHDAQMMLATGYQHWYASRLHLTSPESRFEFGGFRDLSNMAMDMMLIPPTKYWMGSPESDPMAHYLDEILHEVLITKPFWIGKYEVTQEQYRSIMDRNPSYFVDTDPEISPVERVTWLNCKSFCEKTGTRLPTEAQWELACRAGTTSAFYFGDVSKFDAYVYSEENADRPGPVNSKLPNGWGLYNMSGNVWEHCVDNLRSYNRIEETVDPIGYWQSSTQHMRRGGGFRSTIDFTRSARRGWGERNIPHDDLGFRVCKNI